MYFYFLLCVLVYQHLSLSNSMVRYVCRGASKVHLVKREKKKKLYHSIFDPPNFSLLKKTSKDPPFSDEAPSPRLGGP
jgi:hypothetical protein